MRWVHARIADFGGDPKRGDDRRAILERAADLLPSVRARQPGTVQRGQSSKAGRGVSLSPSPTPSRPDPASPTAVGCPDGGDVPGLPARPPHRCAASTRPTDFPWSRRGPRPCRTIPSRTSSTGDFARVPVLIGTNRDEARTFFAEPKISTEPDYRQVIANFYGTRGGGGDGHYPWHPDPADNGFTGNYLLSATVTDSFFACGNRSMVAELAAFTPTFVYEFAHRDGPGPRRQISPATSGAPGMPPNCRTCGRALTTEFPLRPPSTRPSGGSPGTWCPTGARSSPRAGRPARDSRNGHRSTSRLSLMSLDTGKRPRADHRRGIRTDPPMRVLGCVQPVAPSPGWSASRTPTTRDLGAGRAWLAGTLGVRRRRADGYWSNSRKAPPPQVVLAILQWAVLHR